jgi:hypothetical protein
MHSSELQQLLPGRSLQVDCLNLLSRLIAQQVARDDIVVVDAVSWQEDDTDLSAILHLTVCMLLLCVL